MRPLYATFVSILAGSALHVGCASRPSNPAADDAPHRDHAVAHAANDAEPAAAPVEKDDVPAEADSPGAAPEEKADPSIETELAPDASAQAANQPNQPDNAQKGAPREAANSCNNPAHACKGPAEFARADWGQKNSYFDKNGCLRQRCDDFTPCPTGQTCYNASTDGGCLASQFRCEDRNGKCSCMGSRDCNGNYCI